MVTNIVWLGGFPAAEHQRSLTLWPVPNYIAWWTEALCVNNFPKVVTWQFAIINSLHCVVCAELVTRRLQVWVPPGALPGNDLGQVVHSHVPLSPSSITWYWSHCQERNGSIWERSGPCSWVVFALTAGWGSYKRRWAPTWKSQSCERAVSYTHLTLPTNREV